MLVLEDLHWADDSTMALITYLSQRHSDLPLLIVGTFREEEAEARTELREMLEATIRDRLCRRVELKRLDRWDCDQLVRAMLPGGRVDSALLEHVYARSLGNPREDEGDYRFLCTGDTAAFAELGTRFLQMPLGTVERVDLAEVEAAA